MEQRREHSFLALNLDGAQRCDVAACGSQRSAEWHSAVSPVGNRPPQVYSRIADYQSAIQQVTKLRYREGSRVVVGLSCVSAPSVSKRTAQQFSDAFVPPSTRTVSERRGPRMGRRRSTALPRRLTRYFTPGRNFA